MSQPLKIWGHLNAEVVNKGLCMYCGTCIASCPVNVLHRSDEQKPIIKGICALCQLCYYGCPRTGLPKGEIEKALFGRARTESEQSYGIVEEAYFARSTDKEVRSRGQDGGVVSSLLIQALKERLIDVAVTTKASPESLWNPKPALAFSREEVLEACGSKYTVAGSLSVLADAVAGYPEYKVGYVGVPCQIEGLRKMGYSTYSNRRVGESVKLAIGVFCLNSFMYKGLVIDYLQEKSHVDLRRVEKFDIKKGQLILWAGEERLFETPLSSIKETLLPGCAVCQDFTAELADVSVGSADAPAGWATVLVRTDLGRELFSASTEEGLVESKPIKRLKTTLKIMIKLAEKKKLRPAPYLQG